MKGPLLSSQKVVVLIFPEEAVLGPTSIFLGPCPRGLQTHRNGLAWDRWQEVVPKNHFSALNVPLKRWSHPLKPEGHKAMKGGRVL